MLSTAYHFGDRVEISGIYRSVHYSHRWDDEKLALVKGQEFPRCSKCVDCEFVLVKAAPGATEIAGFNRPANDGGSASAAD